MNKFLVLDNLILECTNLIVQKTTTQVPPKMPNPSLREGDYIYSIYISNGTSTYVFEFTNEQEQHKKYIEIRNQLMHR